jgi:uncharacterized membrane protein YvbJ
MEGVSKMFCANCGNRLTDGTNFCPYCGNPVVGKTTEETKNIEEQTLETHEENIPDEPLPVQMPENNDAPNNDAPH